MLQWKHETRIPAHLVDNYLNRAAVEGYTLSSIFLIEDKEWVPDDNTFLFNYYYNVIWFKTNITPDPIAIEVYEGVQGMKVLLQESFDVMDYIKRSCSAVPTKVYAKFNDLYDALKNIDWIDKNNMRKD